MAVFTEVSLAEAAALMQHLAAGTLESLVGISSGIENTNYFADTTQARFVITVFERLSRLELPFYLGLMRHLAQRSLPVPCPLAAGNGELVHTLVGKPAAVAPRLPGAPLQQPSQTQCERLASTLAELHLAGRDYASTQHNPRGLQFWQSSAAWLPQHLDQDARELLATELLHQEDIVGTREYAALPRGAIHADLFRDNVLFEADRPTGILDFYFACTDTFLYDIAVCLNDWCTHANGALDQPLAAAFVGAYGAVRALQAQEHELLPDLLRAAALRFWISRLTDIHAPRDARLLQPKDPAQFQRILQLRAAQR